MGDGCLDLLVQLVQQIGTSHWANVSAVFKWISELECSDRVNELALKCFSHALFDDDAFGGNAYLAAILKASDNGSANGLINIRISQDHERVGPAQFQDTFFQQRAGLCSNG